MYHLRVWNTLLWSAVKKTNAAFFSMWSVCAYISLIDTFFNVKPGCCLSLENPVTIVIPVSSQRMNTAYILSCSHSLLQWNKLNGKYLKWQCPKFSKQSHNAFDHSSFLVWQIFSFSLNSEPMVQHYCQGVSNLPIPTHLMPVLTSCN